MMKKVLILAGLVCLAGCMPHFKDMDSYNVMFREGEAPPTGKGDPYTFGGIAEGSGGQMPRQTYANDSGIPDFRDATETGKLGQIDKDRVETPDVRQGGDSVNQGRRQSIQPGAQPIITRGGNSEHSLSFDRAPDSVIVEIPGATNVEPSKR